VQVTRPAASTCRSGRARTPTSCCSKRLRLLQPGIHRALQPSVTGRRRQGVDEDAIPQLEGLQRLDQSN
jgi:hypothetical protein